MSNPIPQLVNISHALQSDTIGKIRRDIKDFHDAAKLKPEQVEAINHYISSLKSAFGQFTEDNKHVERQEAGVTSADRQLYSGLKSMYMDYLNQLGSIKREKVLGDEEVSKDKPVDYISEELPYLQPTERKEYIDGLFMNDFAGKNLGKSRAFLDGMINLCVLDSTVTENLRCYITFLRKVGYTKEELKNLLPKGLSSMPLLSSNANVEEKSKEPTSTSKKASSSSTKSAQSNANLDPTQSSTGASATGGGDEEPKKKISFSRYLKKGDGNENGKRKSSVVEEDTHTVKKAKTNGGGSGELRSILRTAGGNTSSSSNSKKSSNIKFVDDSHLVTVFGEGLPSGGLQLSPGRLKKVLKPFKEGEPREIVHVEGFKDKAAELDIEFDLSPEESDIIETKGGPIPCETVTPLKHKLNFANFSPDLGNKPIREAVVVEDSMFKNKSPLIAKAFGKNSLLLRKDRGGLPYKRIPDVTPNDYPPRP